ncbi:MAG: hypothetical protein ACOC8Y_02680 [Candidatus Natronoplasma sp.]
MRAYKTFTNILLDDKVTQPICRFRFDGRQKQLCVFDDEKNEEKIPNENNMELAKYLENMVKSIQYYDTGVYEKSSDDTSSDDADNH